MQKWDTPNNVNTTVLKMITNQNPLYYLFFENLNKIKSMFKIFLSCKSRDYGSDNKIINAFSLPDNYIIGGQVN
ncbi:MAG: hypothetical protein WAT22_06040 [Saprospiraceae bacterium]|jgi:hypothetical protein|nr:hypothetical protein [Saprospiraceae bacterium]MBP6448665.1 hypothetical protein [Saprospiraceae bacterium]